MALAGVREFIFIWELSSETLVKFFKAHYGRIIHMSSLTDGMFFYNANNGFIITWILHQIFHVL